jgi:hypothetical protein
MGRHLIDHDPIPGCHANTVDQAARGWLHLSQPQRRRDSAIPRPRPAGDCRPHDERACPSVHRHARGQTPNSGTSDAGALLTTARQHPDHPDMHVTAAGGHGFRCQIVTAPEQVRRQLAGLPLKRQVEVTARFRLRDLARPAEAFRAAMASVARRHQDLTAEIARLDAALEELLTHAAPRSCWPSRAWPPRSPPPCWPPPATTPSGSAPRPASPRCAAPARSMPPPASRSATGSTAAATGRPTPRCERSP